MLQYGIFGGRNTVYGKTRYVMDKYGYSSVYRVTDYKNSFDGYKGEDVMCLDEFNSSLNIQFMNNLLDCYPLTLPARYSNKQMCATKIYIISNIPLNEQYKLIQYEHFSIYRAFLRRINYIIKFNQDGSIDEREYKGEMLYEED